MFTIPSLFTTCDMSISTTTVHRDMITNLRKENSALKKRNLELTDETSHLKKLNDFFSFDDNDDKSLPLNTITSISSSSDYLDAISLRTALIDRTDVLSREELKLDAFIFQKRRKLQDAKSELLKHTRGLDLHMDEYTSKIRNENDKLIESHTTFSSRNAELVDKNETLTDANCTFVDKNNALTKQLSMATVQNDTLRKQLSSVHAYMKKTAETLMNPGTIE